MTDTDMKFHLMDSKVGERGAFSTIEEAHRALQTWIDLQRHAGEPVVQQKTGQWTDSRLSVWVTDPQQTIVRLDR